MPNMLTNGAIFSTFKQTYSLTVSGRSTLKGGEVNGVYSDTGSSANWKELQKNWFSEGLTRTKPEIKWVINEH